MFELLIQRDRTLVQDSVVPVNWCVSPETIAKLGRDYGITDPQLLIVTVPESGGKGTRKLVPLDDLMTFIAFSRPGRNRVCAFIIGGAYAERIRRHGLWGDEHWGKVDVCDADGALLKDLSERNGFAPSQWHELSELARQEAAGEPVELDDGSNAHVKTMRKLRVFLAEHGTDSTDDQVFLGEIGRLLKVDEKEYAGDPEEKPSVAQRLAKAKEDFGKPILRTEEFAAAIDVDVPAELFAKQPPTWEQAWVNWMASEAPEDQCNYRRRRLWAYSGQIPVFLLIYLWRVLAALFYLMLAVPGVNFGPLLHPLRDSSSDIYANLREPFYAKTIGEYVPILPLFALTPMSVAVFGGLTWMLFEWGDEGEMPLLDWLLWSVPIVFGIILGLLMLLGVIVLCVMSVGGFKEWVRNRHARADWWSDEETVEYLACRRDNPFLTVGDLPRRKRTFRLRFLDLKAKVCRPFPK